MQALRASDNYTEARLTELGPRSYELWMNSVLDAPGYVEALFVSLLRVSGAEEPQATIIRREEDEHHLPPHLEGALRPEGPHPVAWMKRTASCMASRLLRGG